MPRKISSATSLETLRKEAKRWLKALRAGDAEARVRLDRAYPAAPRDLGLRDVQHALAREYGYDDWVGLRQDLAQGDAVGVKPLLDGDAYEQLARDYAHAFNQRDDAALAQLNRYYEREFTFDDVAAEGRHFELPAARVGRHDHDDHGRPHR